MSFSKEIKLDEVDEIEWWKKPPRSSRICYRCGHKYSSHIDVKCLKLVQRRPIRIECSCKGFIASKDEMDLVTGKKTLKSQKRYNYHVIR